MICPKFSLWSIRQKSVLDTSSHLAIHHRPTLNAIRAKRLSLSCFKRQSQEEEVLLQGTPICQPDLTTGTERSVGTKPLSLKSKKRFRLDLACRSGRGWLFAQHLTQHSCLVRNIQQSVTQRSIQASSLLSQAYRATLPQLLGLHSCCIHKVGCHSCNKSAFH